MVRSKGGRSARAIGAALVLALIASCSDSEPVAPAAPDVRDAPASNATAESPVAESPDAAAPVADASADAADPIAEERALAERMVSIACEGTLAKRPQAAQRLSAMGEAAVLAVRQVVGTTTHDLARLGPDLLRPMAELDAPDLRERLWEAVTDADYPYRPAATKWLAETARDDEWARFEPLLADPLSSVRAAALSSIATRDDRSLVPMLEAALEDRSDVVRRAAADLLVQWDRAYALRWLFEDLSRTDRFFDLETGESARYESARVLRRLLDDRALFGYQPGVDPNDPANHAALTALGAAIEARVGADERRPPAFARSTDVVVDGVLGLEIRSCRRGEYFVAIADDDRLVVGTGRPTEYALEPGASARIADLVAARFDATEGPTMWGELGCDIECYRVRVPGGPNLVLRVMKGPEEVDDLRPDLLDELVRALVAEVPTDVRPSGLGGSDDDTLRALLSAALESVGGDLR
jgi:hypothetical protein